MDDPGLWLWVWLLAALAFAVGEMATPGSFFLLPFAAGAAVAAVLFLVDLNLTVQWIAFVSVTVVTTMAVRPLARRVNVSDENIGVGSLRMLGQEGVVLEDIPGEAGLGLVLIDREEWRAESTDGVPIPTGTQVQVAEVRGTRVVVTPLGTYSPGDGARM
jgi:membrane protein implicated in regulation of membrane protease activity